VIIQEIEASKGWKTWKMDHLKVRELNDRLMPIFVILSVTNLNNLHRFNFQILFLVSCIGLLEKWLKVLIHSF